MLDRFDRLLIASLAAHGIVLAAIALSAPKSSPLSLPEPLPPAEYEVSFEPQTSPRSSFSDQEESPGGAPAAPGRLALRVDLTGKGGTVPFPVTSADPGVESPLPSAASSGQAQASAGNGTGRPVDLGLGHGAFWPRYEANQSPAPPKPLSTSGGLREILAQRDVALGLGAGGPVVSAARTVAQSSIALGFATMIVRADARGKVVSVRVADVTQDMAEWARVASSLHAALQAALLRLPPGAKGVEIAIRIEASRRLPSGSRRGVTPSTGPGTAGFDFDLVDIGQKPVRVIATTILSERAI